MSCRSGGRKSSFSKTSVYRPASRPAMKYSPFSFVRTDRTSPLGLWIKIILTPDRGLWDVSETLPMIVAKSLAGESWGSTRKHPRRMKRKVILPYLPFSLQLLSFTCRSIIYDGFQSYCQAGIPLGSRLAPRCRKEDFRRCGHFVRGHLKAFLKR